MSLSIRNLAGDEVYRLHFEDHTSITLADLRIRLAGICSVYHGALTLLTLAGNDIGKENDDVTLSAIEIEKLIRECDNDSDSDSVSSNNEAGESV